MFERLKKQKATVDLNSLSSYKSKFVALIPPLPTGLLWLSILFQKEKKKNRRDMCGKKCLWVNDAVGRSMVHKRWEGVLFSCNQVLNQEVMAVLSASQSSQSQRFSRTNSKTFKVLFHIFNYW